MVSVYDTTVTVETTQPNPSAAVKDDFAKLIDAAVDDFLSRLFSEGVDSYKKINEWADEPLDANGNGRGFLKPEHRPTSYFTRKSTKKFSNDDFLGFVTEDNISRVRPKTTSLYSGTNTKAAEAVVKAWKAFLGKFQEAKLNKLYDLTKAMEKDPSLFLPLGEESGGAFPDNGPTGLNPWDFHLASLLMRAYGGWRGFSVGSAVGKLNLEQPGPAAQDFGLLYSQAIPNDDGEIELRRVTMGFDQYVQLQWGQHMKPLSILSEAQRKHQKDNLGVDHWIRKEFDKDDSVYFPLGSNNQEFQAFLKDFLDRLARNYPHVIRMRLDGLITGMLKQVVRADKKLPEARSFAKGKPKPPPPPPAKPEAPRELNPIDLQCFLMENIGLLADFKAAQASPYQNLMQLYGSNAPGETISILNCKGKQEQVKRLLNLAPSTYAALVPYIKLYRLAYTNADDADPLLPIAQQEIPIPNYMDPADISRITSGQIGRAGGWGLQSFTWKLDGLQPETVDNNISANLKLYFQSVDDLFKGSRNAAGRDQAGRAQPGPLDLLIPSEACRKSDDDDDDPLISSPPPPPTCEVENQQAKSQGRDGACFRIKVVAGWATPPNLEETHPELKKKAAGSHETEGAILRRALRDTRITLYLQQTRHNLSFNENGSVLLSIDYQAALSGILTDNRMDILGTNDTAIAAELKELKAKAKGASEAMDRIAAQGQFGGTGTPSKAQLKALRDDAAYKAQKKKQKEYLQEQIDLQNQDKLKKHKRFLSRLYGRHDGGKSASPKMYVVEVDPKLVRQKKLADEKDPEERAKRARQLMTNSSATRGWAITNPLTYEAGKSGKNSDLLELLEGIDDPVKASKATDKMSKQFQNNLYSGKNMYIPYFYLGDLIDSILQNNDSLRTDKKNVPSGFGVFMAEMHVTNPLLLYQAPEKEQTKLMCSSYDSIKSSKLLRQLKAKGYIFDGGIKKRINIGQIPIALDQFNVWFKNKVVKGGLDSYYLLHFIKDICAQLITDSLKKTCFNNNIINNIRFDVSHIHFNNRDSKGAPKYPNGPLHTVPVRSLARLMGDDDTLYRDVPPLGIPPEERVRYNMTSGLVLYCTDSKVRNRLGRKGIDSDQDVGIYHNYVGSPVGLVKKLSFSRVQQQYLRESKIQKYGNLGAEQLRELYSANLELVGNTLYKNGQYTFLWPSAMTSGDDSRVINLGLGGYFLIKSVDHTISPSGYTVRMTALQEGMEVGPEAEVILQPIDGDISPSTNQFFTTEDGRLRYEQQMRDRAARRKAERAAQIAAAQAAEARAQASAEATAERAKKGDTTMDVGGTKVDVARGTSKESLESAAKRIRAEGNRGGGSVSVSSGGSVRRS